MEYNFNGYDTCEGCLSDSHKCSFCDGEAIIVFHIIHDDNIQHYDLCEAHVVDIMKRFKEVGDEV